MSRRFAGASFSALAAAALLSVPVVSSSQPTLAPTNDKPNPFSTIEGWAKLPEGRNWGSTSAVEIDKDGVSIWVAERCQTNSCVGSNLDPILHFDANGKLIKSFGAGMIQFPHGIFVDRDGNVWVTDGATGGGRGGRAGRGGGDTTGRAAAPPPPPGATPAAGGHQIYKFSPDGKLLMTLGVLGGGRDTAYFWQPNDVIVGPNGDIWVAEGHGSQQKSTPARILRFDKTGKLLGTWGTVVDSLTKNEPYSFDQPHALAFDSRGRLFVGDRGYNRIKIFDQSMKLIDTWYQFSRPSGIYIDKNDDIYVADSESGSVSRDANRNYTRQDWTRGIRVGSAKDGSIKYFIPDPMPNCAPGSTPAAGSCATNTSAAEGVAVDSKGNIYGAEVGPRAVKRYVKK